MRSVNSQREELPRFESLPHRSQVQSDSLVTANTQTSWSATSEERRAYQSLQSFSNRIARFCARLQNAFIDLIHSSKPIEASSPELYEILSRSRVRTDINDHLPTLFIESLNTKPRLIIELGVRDGESTFVFERVARLCDARVVSVDIKPASRLSQDERWRFVQSDDIEFAKRFPAWCRENGLPKEIDILFIDTSHFFEHTVQEIAHWFPLLAPRAKVFFHDTNLRRIYFRKDGSMGVAWSNRGVIRALEKFFSKNFNEREEFTASINGWVITHYAQCSGFTILTRNPLKSENR